MKDTTMRFRPYLKQSTVILFERTREATGLSIGKILMALLVESPTFIQLSENEDKTDEELEKIFRGLYLDCDNRHNSEKKDKYCNT